MLEDEDIQAIETSLKAPINVETHFEDFVAHIKDNQEAVATQKPYTTGKILYIYYTLVFKVGFYPIKWREWRRKDAPDKTWNTSKIHFAQKFKEVSEERANSGTRAYAENVEIRGDAIGDTSELSEMAQDMTTALEIFSTATTTKINTFNELTKKIDDQSSQTTTLKNVLLASTEYAAKLKTGIATIKRSNGYSWQGSRGWGDNKNNSRTRRPF